MMDLEDRLRGTFTGMADEVPASANPRADLERRLATRRSDRWRMPALAAAAAVVVAAVVTPMVVFQGDDGVGAADQTTSAGQTEPGVTDGLDPPPGAMPLGNFTKNGKDWQAVAYHEENKVCVLAMATDGSESGQPGCTEIGPWPHPPAIGHTQTISVLSEGLPDSGPLPNLLLFVTSPQVVELTVRNGPGEPVALEKLGVSDTGTLWLADFEGSTQGYGWDAKDAAGNYIDGGIT